ncbi:MAG TPA: MFS transporter [Microbacteriaceae bacterium]|nr:MFS transporter [Microbacteriaceae bacterium]
MREQPTPVSIWRAPGMPALLVMTALGFAGFALLLPTAPLWARHGGADEGGAGLVNAVLLIATVLVQTAVPWALRTLGWRVVLTAGVVLLGAPSALYILTDALPALLALSAIRGAGFAILTVCGSSAVVRLIAPSHRGRAIGIYGLAIAVPQTLFVPTSAFVAEFFEFWVVFALGALPVLAIPVTLRLGARLDRLAVADQTTAAAEPVVGRGRAFLALAVPMLVLLAITTPGGALLTFAPQLGFSALVVMLALFVFTVMTALSRWLAGGLADRYGPALFVIPLFLIGATGIVLIAWSVGTSPPTVAMLMVGVLLLGTAYGALQNLTLVVSFAAVPARLRDTASAAWNIGFDTGTGLGALAVGFIAAGTDFTVAFLITAALGLLVAALYGVHLAFARRR